MAADEVSPHAYAPILSSGTVDKSGYYEIINGTQGQTNLRSKHKRGRGRGAREWEKNRSLGATTSDTSR